MKQVHNSIELDLIDSNSITLTKIKKLIIKPIFIGLFVFSIFFSTILITKVSAYILTENAIFNLSIHDFLFALIGFASGFSVEFLLQIKRILIK